MRYVAARRSIARTRRLHAWRTSWIVSHLTLVTAAVTMLVGLVALVPVFATFDVPFTVEPVRIPAYIRQVAPGLPAGTVLLTVPFAVSGSTQPMLWQAVDDMHFRLAGAALKTPNALGGPVGQGAPGSARRILTDLTVSGPPLPTGTPAQLATVRRCPAGVAGGPGGDRRAQPRSGVRVRVLHQGARARADLRRRRLRLDAATGRPDGGARGGTPPWPCAAPLAARAERRGQPACDGRCVLAGAG